MSKVCQKDTCLYTVGIVGRNLLPEGMEYWEGGKKARKEEKK